MESLAFLSLLIIVICHLYWRLSSFLKIGIQHKHSLGLLSLGSFPLVGFIFYLFFGRNHRKEKMYRKKYFLDKQAFLTVEGEYDPRSEEKISLMASIKENYLPWRKNLGNSPISFDTKTKVLTNGEETFQHILRTIKESQTSYSSWNIILFAMIILVKKLKKY